MRSRYIRFFISSTFADMTKERNLLAKLFAYISDEYVKKGWQIEAVDLRWGISQEAGYDNKTMQICKSEIKRCQQLSPRPNFIVLLGNRYGWTPLPETIPLKVAKSLSMTSAERLLFNKWYRLDENALPDGEYILQGREGMYREPVVWFDDVEYPLSLMFNRNAKRIKWRAWEFVHKSKSAISHLFGESATEQEIHLGAFDISDSKEHVIAYLRDITGVYPEEESTYLEQGEVTVKKLSALKAHLEEILNEDNILKVQKTFENYLSENFDAYFVSEMEKRIRGVIDKAILEYDAIVATTEDQIHIAIAKDEAMNVVGREKELAEIDQYIGDVNEHRPLWIKASSGSGKSAFLAKVIVNHLHTHHVICRFCGRSAGTLTTEDIAFIRKSWEFKNFTKELTCPTLIVLDALNQLDDKDDLQFSSLKWLNREIPNNIKIIVSTINNLTYSHSPEFLKIYELPDMGPDSEKLVMNVLNQSGRRLTKEQLTSLHKIIENSDHSALYLHMLGHHLRRIASWDDISNIPSDLEGLVREMTKELIRPERHGAPIVGEALCFLTLDRTGLTDREMIELLSENDYVRKALEAGSFHPIDTQKEGWRLPSVLWSRLRYDLSPFLRTYMSKVGQVTTIYHDELKSIIFNYYFESPSNLADSTSRLFHYYKRRIHSNDAHALLEIIRSTIDYNAFEKILPYIGEATELICSDLDFLLTKYRQYPRSLMEDFNTLLPFYNGDTRERLAALKRSLSSLPQDATNEQLLLYMYGLPTSSILHRLASEKIDESRVMKNLMADSGWEDSTIYSLSELGECPCMSDDGTKVASLFENRHNIRVADLVHPEKSVSITVSEEVFELQCDDEMKHLAVMLKKECFIYDIKSDKVILSRNIGERGWISLSANGDTFAFGDVTKAQVYSIDFTGEENVMLFDYKLSGNDSPLMCGRLEYTGQYLWLLFKDKDLLRRNISTKEEKGWNIGFTNKDGKEIDELANEFTCIPTCTKNWCVCFHQEYYYLVNIEGSWLWNRHWNYLDNKPRIALSRDEKQLMIHGGRWQDEYCHIDSIIKDPNQYGFNLRYVGHSLMRGLEIVNGNISIALNSAELRIFDISIQLKKYSFPEGNLGGVNSLSCSKDGGMCVISCGKNIGMEMKKDITIITGEKFNNWIPPFESNQYRFSRYSRISPIAEYISIGSVDADKQSELMLYSLKQEDIICKYNSGRDECSGLSISSDGKYCVAHFKDIWRSEKNEDVLIINKSGKIVLKRSLLDKWDTEEGIIMTDDNLYTIAFTKQYGNGSEKEGTVISGKYCIYNNININLPINEVPIGLYVTSYHNRRPLFAIGPQGEMYTNDIKSGELIKYTPTSGVQDRMACDKFILGISPSKQLMYFSDKNHILYSSCIPFNNQFVKIREHVQFVIPTFDDNHIYIVDDEFTILLYNICTKEVEQKTFCDKVNMANVYAQGLYAFNKVGNVYKLVNDAKYNVNIPAITTFVRRWNLETKEQEAPTAVCPMCGHQFGLPVELSKVIIDIPSEIKHTEWDNPRLKGHRCPHCGSQLQFNPYISQ